MPSLPCEPSADCRSCPRLTAFRHANRAAHADWFNAPVPSFGDEEARLLVVGLAPGLRGANRTGRPFTGDYAGHLLYDTLLAFGFARGRYGERPDDRLELRDCMITNAVRCVPPENKPTAREITQCRHYLLGQLQALPRLQAVVALGRIAHDSVLRALGEKPARHAFAHGAEHGLSRGVILFDSYHCSRYNTNTGRLSEAMFRAVFERARARLS